MTRTSPTLGRSPAAAHSLLVHARQVLGEAEAATDAGDRFRLAHLSALRTAAAVSAQRGRPASVRRRLMNVWVLLERVAPEHAGWAAYFAAGAPIRAAVEAGALSAVTARAADDQLRSAGQFLELVESTSGLLAA
ncbi:SAV_6107 family HEPN domain-containing protein [uncultured Jatrophihabitans sp.]|uniref:SAV_6107 family HEPN domain-containing protein n=1 Tax=uncultured Jatrophihabitans sp. TaxID=1610747 RepID=UPI0035CA636E